MKQIKSLIFVAPLGLLLWATNANAIDLDDAPSVGTEVVACWHPANSDYLSGALAESHPGFCDEIRTSNGTQFYSGHAFYSVDGKGRYRVGYSVMVRTTKRGDEMRFVRSSDTHEPRQGGACYLERWQSIDSDTLRVTIGQMESLCAEERGRRAPGKP